MEELLPLAEQLAIRLKQRRETVAVAESSSGGLLSAAVLAIRGASAYFLAGAVVYTRRASAPRPAGAWPRGAAGPTGNSYRDSPGHTCLAISGATEQVITLETDSIDRVANMRAFAAAGLELLQRHLS